MINNDLTGLLNLAYEIEGLLMLHINRGDEASPEMKKLLIAKAEKLLSDLRVGNASVENSVAVNPESAVSVPAAEKVPVYEPETVTVTVDDSVTEEERKDDEAIAANALNEEREDAEPQPTVNDTLGGDGQLTLDEKLARERAADISKAFTLNDRFRFRRELFRNSDEEFKETLDVIASMSSMEEAEDYFFNDLCWDDSNPVVKEFMAVVAKHF